jgi:hypothetical protein
MIFYNGLTYYYYYYYYNKKNLIIKSDIKKLERELRDEISGLQEQFIQSKHSLQTKGNFIIIIN